MKLLSLLLVVACLGAANIHEHGVVEPCAVYPNENPTVISFGNDIVFDTRDGEPELASDYVIESYEVAGYYMVQLTGPIYKDWTEELKQAGLEILGYLPRYTYIVYASNEQIAGIRDKSFVQWTGIFQPAYKVHKELFVANGNGRISIQIFPNEDVHDVASQIRAMGNEVLEVIDHPICKSIEAKIDFAQLSNIANIPGVLYIHPFVQPILHNYNCQWVTQTGWRSSIPSNPGARRVWFDGVVGNGIYLNTTDTGVYTAHYQYYDSAYPINSPGVYPNHRKMVAYKLYGTATFGDHSSHSWHGTHTGCTVAGNDTTYGSSNYDGMAKQAKFYFVDIGTASGLVVSSNLTALYDTIYLGRGLPYNILQSSGSWGSPDNQGWYFMQEASNDAYVFANRDFLTLYSAGNRGGPKTIGHPGLSKNTITVGATLNSTNSNGIAGFSSRGPSQDNRIKPTLMAPGDGTTPWAGMMSARGGTQSSYWGMSGTSMAAPAANGSIGLIRHYLLAGYYPTGSANSSDSIKYQSAALLKAMAVVSCDPNVGPWSPPDFNIGWGRIDVDSVCYFDGDTRDLYLLDDTVGISTGEVITDNIEVNSSIPLRVSLVWSDTAASVGANPTLVNDLHLEVTAPSGTYYRGNQYTTGESTENPADWDETNVEECARINSPEIGLWRIRIRANNTPYGPQPFALVVTGDVTDVGITENPRTIISQPRIDFTGTIVSGRLNFEILLKKTTRVQANIFDLAGRIVQNIIDQKMTEGSHRIDQTIDLPSGVYFVKIDAGELQQIEKVLVIR